MSNDNENRGFRGQARRKSLHDKALRRTNAKFSLYRGKAHLSANGISTGIGIVFDKTSGFPRPVSGLSTALGGGLYQQGENRIQLQERLSVTLYKQGFQQTTRVFLADRQSVRLPGCGQQGGDRRSQRAG
jgi:hypothetical protein